METVEETLERMVPALQDLQERNLMSSTEVVALVDQRRQFEYRLQRRQPRKVDFLRYLDYEFKMDSLRKLRKQRLHATKNTLSDFGQLRHIFSLFERATRMFQADAGIWMQYIDFAVAERAEKRLGKLFPRALQLHPHNVPLWIRAASWQRSGVGSATAARVLLQRALRLNPHAQPLWIEYFRVEVHYVSKVQSRRDILGLDLQASSLERYAVARFVCENAIRTIPYALAFRRALLDVCCEVGNTQYLRQHIMDSIARDFRGTPEAWTLRETYNIDAAGGSCAAKKRKRSLAAKYVDDTVEPTEAKKQSLAVYELGVSAFRDDLTTAEARNDFPHHHPFLRADRYNPKSPALATHTLEGAAVVNAPATEISFPEGASEKVEATLRRCLVRHAPYERSWMKAVYALRQIRLRVLRDYKSEGLVASDGRTPDERAIDQALRCLLVCPASRRGAAVAGLFQPIMEGLLEQETPDGNPPKRGMGAMEVEIEALCYQGLLWACTR